MKKLLSILLTCILIIGTAVMPVSAAQIDYSCYNGHWDCWDWVNGSYEQVAELEISNANSSNMDIYFRYGQFGITIDNMAVDGKTAYGNYYEVWFEGDFVVSGSITLDLGDSGIWVDWHPYENGVDCGIKGFMFKNDDFVYRTIQDGGSVNKIAVIVNGAEIQSEQAPIIVNDRVMVPIRAISESLGAEVSWEDVRKIGRVVGIRKDTRNISFCVDDTGYNTTSNPSHMSIYNDGDESATVIALDAPVMIYNDYTMVPVRAVSEAFNADVAWDSNTQTVTITTK